MQSGKKKKKTYGGLCWSFRVRCVMQNSKFALVFFASVKLSIFRYFQHIPKTRPPMPSRRFDTEHRRYVSSESTILRRIKHFKRNLLWIKCSVTNNKPVFVSTDLFQRLISRPNDVTRSLRSPDPIGCDSVPFSFQKRAFVREIPENRTTTRLRRKGSIIRMSLFRFTWFIKQLHNDNEANFFSPYSIRKYIIYTVCLCKSTRFLAK